MYCKIPGFFTLKISNVVFLQNTKTFNTVCHLKKENYTYGTVIKQINCRFIGPMFAFCNLCRTRTASYPYERTQKDVFSQLYDIRRFLNKLPLIFLRQHIQTDRNFDQTSFELIKSSKWSYSPRGEIGIKSSKSNGVKMTSYSVTVTSGYLSESEITCSLSCDNLVFIALAVLELHRKVGEGAPAGPRRSKKARSE